MPTTRERAETALLDTQEAILLKQEISEAKKVLAGYEDRLASYPSEIEKIKLQRLDAGHGIIEKWTAQLDSGQIPSELSAMLFEQNRRVGQIEGQFKTLPKTIAHHERHIQILSGRLASVQNGH